MPEALFWGAAAMLAVGLGAGVWWLAGLWQDTYGWLEERPRLL